MIEITASDDHTFDPDAVTVSVGETITFRITNSGTLPHDFVLGDQETQDTQEAEMRAMDDMEGERMHDDPKAVSIPGSETVEITWHFTEAGTIIYGCHEKNHYDAGMHGTVTVEG